MAKNSPIEWTNDTWNPWQGCRKVSTGCKNCYMYREKKRYGQDGNNIHRSSDDTFYAPLKKLNGPLVFVCSWSDFFIEEADPWRDEAWDIIRQTPHLIYQILTKRPERIMQHLPADWGNGWPNVWLGVSVENDDYTHRMDVLRDIPAALRFVSCEPLLGPITLNLSGFDWVITGGESGPGCRPADANWFIHIRDQCDFVGVRYFHKQNGGTHKMDGHYGGRELNGEIYDEIPPLHLNLAPKIVPHIEPTLDGLLAILSSQTLKSIMSDFTSINLEFSNDNLTAYWQKVYEARINLLDELHREYVAYYDGTAGNFIEDGKWLDACAWVAVDDVDYFQAKEEYNLRDLTPHTGKQVLIVAREE